ncbi:hypothetical protein GE09DRAFT_1059889 [Coniochaeta sp. 2T2.1]|nr:hypothetical protein GE09DRAFT_1059889 [Coniochaeta sp. 2T2.1]
MEDTEERQRFLERTRQNQARAHNQRKERLNELQQRVSDYEKRGIEASLEMQQAARRVAGENARLRALLAVKGVSDAEVEQWLGLPLAASTSDSWHGSDTSNTQHSTFKRTTTPHPLNMEAYNTEDYDVDGGSAPNDARPFVCLVPHCDSRFKRASDLDRHYKMRHRDLIVSDEDKKTLYCDYKKCPRNQEPFFRPERLRNHLRGYHKEDMPKKGTKSSTEWLRERNVDPKWWRCFTCLMRMQIKHDGFTCSSCKKHCESDRQSLRVQMAS